MEDLMEDELNSSTSTSKNFYDEDYQFFIDYFKNFKIQLKRLSYSLLFKFESTLANTA
jgi:hypothetical protein